MLQRNQLFTKALSVTVLEVMNQFLRVLGILKPRVVLR
nr:unnamed protein product [Callosobruchus analis]